MQINKRHVVGFVLAVFLSLSSGCLIHKQVNCRMRLNLCIMNVSKDTVEIVISKNGVFSSSVDSFSIKDVVLVPSANKTVGVYYSWSGEDGCVVGCIDKDFNGELFEMSFMKDDSLMEKRRIVPCKPCDRPVDNISMNTICADCLEELTDTIYFGR